jgi:enterochelin esterase-like enzyme
VFWPASLRRRSLISVAATAIGVFGTNFLMTEVVSPSPGSLPFDVLVWAWLGISGLVVAVIHAKRGWWALVAALAGLTVLISIGGTQINRFYGQYPTVGVALGLTRPELIDLSTVPASADLLSAPVNGFLSDVWQPSQPLPVNGTLSRIHVEPLSSEFEARDGYVYLPPAYHLTKPRPKLPVLVLMAGNPGSPDMWLISGQLAKTMDDYAARHQGLAPIVVVPDNLGSNFANPLCVDSVKGNAETYLVSDIPEWVSQHLQTAEGPGNWAAGGLSSGGTCALQLATRAPERYGRFLDISGEYQPLNGSKQETVDEYFRGDEGAYNVISPVEIMKGRKFPDTAGRIVVGKDDSPYNSQLQQVLRACNAAGMDMTWLELPGGHNWQVWVPALAQSLDWLAAKTSLVRA